MSPIYNFYAGPAVIYEEVLREAQEEFMNFSGTGMSVLTVSHRSKAFDAVMAEAEANMKELMGCLLYTSPSPRDRVISRMPSSA